MSVLRFLYQTLCAFLLIKDRKLVEQNFHFVAGVMPQGWDFGVLGGSKTLAWGFAMGSHGLSILVFILFICHLLIFADFFRNQLFRKFLSKIPSDVKQLGTRSDPTFCWTRSWSKLFAKVISRWH